MTPLQQVTPPLLERAQAPYNFVPLPENAYLPLAEDPLDQSRFHSCRYSGRIDLSVTTETWLYTRAGVRPHYAAAHPDMNRAIRDDSQSPYREFSHHGDDTDPVIPGSTFRGMIRNLVTILSDGRLDTAATRRFCYRAVGDTNRHGAKYRQRFVGNNRHRDAHPALNGLPHGLPQDIDYPQRTVRGGYLFRQGSRWFIQPALRDAARYGESIIRYDQRDDGLLPLVNKCRSVWVVPEPRKRYPRSKRQTDDLVLHYAVARQVAARAPADVAPGVAGGVKGTLVRTGAIGRAKHLHCIIYEPQANPAAKLQIPDELRDLYVEDLNIRRVTGDPERLGRQLDVGIPEWFGAGPPPEGVPCFYMVERVNGSDQLVFFGGTLFFRLPYRHAPSEVVSAAQGAAPDLAARLFGTAAGKNSGCRGRLRFEDLLLDRTNAHRSPYIGAFADGYCTPTPLLQPKPACIQHYLVQPSAEPLQLRHYDDATAAPSRPGPQPDATLLRGFKQYWHRWSLDQQDPSRVAREASTEPQGGDIHTVIRPVQENVRFRGCIRFDNLTGVELGALLVALQLRPHLRHRLGMARPLGYGSVRVACEAVRIFDPAARYGRLFTDAPQSDRPSLSEASLPNSQQIAERAIISFVCELSCHRHQPLYPDAALDVAIAAFWAHPRMQELNALLEWDSAPNWEVTRQVGVQSDERRPDYDCKSAQWKSNHRWILPPPTAVRESPPVTEASNSPPVTPPRPVETSPRNPQQQIPPAVEELWPHATVSFDACGGGILTALHERKKAQARQAAVQALLEALQRESPQLWERLRNKRKAISLNVSVRSVGNAWEITGLSILTAP